MQKTLGDVMGKGLLRVTISYLLFFQQPIIEGNLTSTLSH